MYSEGEEGEWEQEEGDWGRARVEDAEMGGRQAQHVRKMDRLIAHLFG